MAIPAALVGAIGGCVGGVAVNSYFDDPNTESLKDAAKVGAITGIITGPLAVFLIHGSIGLPKPPAAVKGWSEVDFWFAKVGPAAGKAADDMKSMLGGVEVQVVGG